MLPACVHVELQVIVSKNGKKPDQIYEESYMNAKHYDFSILYIYMCYLQTPLLPVDKRSWLEVLSGK